MATKAISSVGASGFDRVNVTQMRYCHLCLQECLSIADLQNHIAKDHELKHPSLIYVKTKQPHQLLPIEDSKITKAYWWKKWLDSQSSKYYMKQQKFVKEEQKTY